jgi:diguanylate cyclase (GGDEF)-like protein
MTPLLRNTRAAIALAVTLFAVVTAVRFSAESAADGYALLYALPIAVMAIALGFVGGVGAAILAIALVIVWTQTQDVELNLAGYVTRGITFFLLGALVGFEAQRRRFYAERTQLLNRLEQMANTDELTGLGNRRAWGQELRREMERSRRGGDRFAVALLDLDHFKEYNDRHGHPAGDQLLRLAASEWRTRLRVVDTLCRYGGEEFAVLLPDCPSHEAATVIERIRSATPMGQTLSGGIARWDGEETAEALIERVDGALYAAKRAGRDRCVLAG